MRITRTGLIICAALLPLAWSASAAEIPLQYRVWGSTAGKQAEVGADWKEVPPPSDDLAAPEGFPSKEDIARGYVVFVRNPLEPIYPGSFPRADDLNEMRSFAYLGQYLSFSVGVHALKDLKSATMSVSDMVSADGSRLAENQFDIRVVKNHRVPAKKGEKTFYWLPVSLEKPALADIAAGRSQSFWVTAYIAPDVKAGDYTGKAELKSDTEVLQTVSMRLKVLPLRLKRAPQTFCMWQKSISDPVQYQKVMTDLWEHGMNAAWPAHMGEVGNRDVANKNRPLPEDQVVPMRGGAEKAADMWNNSIFAKSPRPSYGTPNTNWVTWNWDKEKDWMVNWPINEHLDNNMIKLIQLTEDVRREKKLPEILYYLYDEPGGHPETFPFALHYYKLLKTKFPHLKTFTTIGGGLAIGIDEISQLAPVVDVLTTNRISEKIIKDIRGYKREFQIYNGGTSVLSAPPRDRLFFGFFAWKSTASGIGQWVYTWNKITASSIRSAGEHGYISPSDDGPVPTANWEAIRGGIDDMRYIVTLYDAIQKARKSGKADAQKEADAAEELLSSIEEMMPIPKEESVSSAEAFRTLSPRTYDKWRWRIAQHLLKLQAMLGLGEGKEEEIPLPNREYKYTANHSSAPKQETELMSGNFENGMEPWLVQTWKGNGSREIDSTIAHNGKASLRMSNSGSNDVIVCTGGNKLQLKAGKSYRFSGWLKTENVSMGVKLRISGKSTRESPGVAGTTDWKQLSCEYTPTMNETPKYLAVWLQGAGKVWVDDLSIVEFDAAPVPPLVVELPHRFVDGDDRAVELKLKPRDTGDPLNVVVRLPGKSALEKVLKPGKDERVVFNAAQLPFGKHEIRVDSASGNHVLCVERVAGPFEK
jgi:hypothetical protein